MLFQVSGILYVSYPINLLLIFDSVSFSYQLPSPPFSPRKTLWLPVMSFMFHCLLTCFIIPERQCSLKESRILLVFSLRTKYLQNKKIKISTYLLDCICSKSNMFETKIMFLSCFSSFLNEILVIRFNPQIQLNAEYLSLLPLKVI